MGTTLDKGEIIADLNEVWGRLIDIGEEIEEDLWTTPTSCPGWSVKDNFAHIIGTEASLAGEKIPSGSELDTTFIKNPIGELNQRWVESMRDWSKASILKRLASLSERRTEQLEALDDAGWQAVGPSPAGQAPYARFMQIRVFDCYMHEQDIRQAVDIGFHPYGGAAERSLAEIAPALGFVIGKKAAAPKGSVVRFIVSGGTSSTFDYIVDERASISYDLHSTPTTTITIGFLALTRLVGGRIDGGEEYRSRIAIAGDVALGNKILDNINYLI